MLTKIYSGVKKMNIVYKEISFPELDRLEQVILDDSTMQERKHKIITSMDKEGYDYLVIYCDLEHGGNFEYLTGFVTRFEESLLVFGREKAYLIAGNENVNMAAISRIPMESILYPDFSLPDQPFKGTVKLEEIFEKIGLKDKKIGLVGWKLFEDDSYFDVPFWIVEGLKKVTNCLKNATGIFIDPEFGARTINNANEVAHYEYGAALASVGILKALKGVREEISETELGTLLNHHGQREVVVSIAAAGKRFENAVIYPTEKKLKRGDTLSLTVGYKGGLQSRAGLVAEDVSEGKAYLEDLAIPYFKAIVTWLENIKIGMTGDALYQLIDEVLPKENYNWVLNPGHLCGDEEWLSSPVYSGSRALLKSGMILQFDIIPSLKGYGKVSCEGGIVLADSELRRSIRQNYPLKYEAFMKRREYMQNVLGIQISDDVLPMGNAAAFYNPLMLSKKALVVE